MTFCSVNSRAVDCPLFSLFEPFESGSECRVATCETAARGISEKQASRSKLNFFFLNSSPPHQVFGSILDEATV